jgi:hypothetical protein
MYTLGATPPSTGNLGFMALCDRAQAQLGEEKSCLDISLGFPADASPLLPPTLDEAG